MRVLFPQGPNNYPQLNTHPSTCIWIFQPTVTRAVSILIVRNTDCGKCSKFIIDAQTINVACIEYIGIKYLMHVKCCGGLRKSILYIPRGQLSSLVCVYRYIDACISHAKLWCWPISENHLIHIYIYRYAI